jgi:hypothetical protein
MTSVSANPGGVADLLQTFSGTGASASSSALASTLASTKVQTALQSASPGDIVQLSEQAVLLQRASDLFGNSNSSYGSTSTANSTINLLG